MSFLAVMAILIFYKPLNALVPAAFLEQHRWAKWAWAMVVVSCSAQLGVAPLTAYYFGRFSTYFLLTNFIVVPTATLILWLAPVVLLIPSCAYLFLYIVSLLNIILTFLARLPLASIDNLHPTTLQVAMIYVIIASVYLLILCLRRTPSPRREW
jgi:competence protein ComEC